jgi:plastocyanin
MSWKPKSVIVTFSVAASLLFGSVAASAGSAETVEIEGTVRVLTGNVTPAFIPNELVRLPNSLIGLPGPGGIEETFRFDSFDVDVASGGMLRWTNTTVAPHTITIVRRSDQPQNLAAAFACFAPTAACGAAAAKHFPQGFNNPPVLDIGNLALGDTHLVGPVGGPLRTSFQTTVNLPRGTVLFYMCGFHPQMQGTIIVEGN